MFDLSVSRFAASRRASPVRSEPVSGFPPSPWSACSAWDRGSASGCRRHPAHHRRRPLSAGGRADRL